MANLLQLGNWNRNMISWKMSLSRFFFKISLLLQREEELSIASSLSSLMQCISKKVALSSVLSHVKRWLLIKGNPRRLEKRYMIWCIWLICRSADVLTRSHFQQKVQMQPPLENMKIIKRKKSVKMKSNDYNLLISIHSNPQLEILHSCDRIVL